MSIFNFSDKYLWEFQSLVDPHFLLINLGLHRNLRKNTRDHQPTLDPLSNRQTVHREAGSWCCPIVSLVAWLKVDKCTYSCLFDVCVLMQTKIMTNNVTCRD